MTTTSPSFDRPEPSGAAAPRKRFAPRLTAGIALVLAILMTLLAVTQSRLLLAEWQELNSTRDGLAAAELAYKAMSAAERASFERGPSNAMLGAAEAADPALRKRLADARAKTDETLLGLTVAIGRHCPAGCQASEDLRVATDMLNAARNRVDAVSSLPREQRTSVMVSKAVNRMFEVIPILIGMTSELSKTVIDTDPQQQPAMLGALLAVELREYAGRLGSLFTAALTEQRQLTEAERRDIAMMRGRITQLHDLIRRQGELSKGDPIKLGALTKMDAEYFGNGLAFVDAVETALDKAPFPAMTTAAFAASYVPPMKSIVEVRDTLMQAALESAQRRHEAAQRNLVADAAMGMAALVLIVVMFLMTRRLVSSIHCSQPGKE